MKKLTLVFIVLILSQNIIAQVLMHYEKQLTGKMYISDIGAVNVTNFTGTDIDYIYKGWALDANAKKVIEIKSNVLRQSRGSTNYNKNDKFYFWKKGELNFKITKCTIDTSSYSGSLTYYSELLHPIDKTSIIAREKKQVHLKNGLYVSDTGKLMTDARLMNVNFDHNYNDKFQLDHLFTKMQFDNKNDADCCQTLSFEITQDETKIYASTLENFCAPVGKSYLSESQIEALNVSVNTYKARNKTLPINVSYRLGKINGSREISNIYHSEFDFSTVQYTHHATGLSFDFINSAIIESNFSVSSTVIEMNQDSNIERMDWVGMRGRFGTETMYMYHPFFTRLIREDYNGSVDVSMLKKENFNGREWNAFIGFINNIDQSEIIVTRNKNITELAPRLLSNMRKSYGSNRVKIGYAFVIIDQETATLYEASYFKLLVEDPNSPKRERLDLKEALKNIQYNGIHLGFSFENEVLKEIKLDEREIVSQDDKRKKRDKMRRYHHHFTKMNSATKKQYIDGGKLDVKKLDQKIANDNSTAISDIPQFIVNSPHGIKNLKTQTTFWDSIDIQLTYRSTGSNIEQQSNRKEMYEYEEMYRINSSAYMWQGVSSSSMSGHQNQKIKNLTFTSILLDINSQGQHIELAKLIGLPSDAKWIKELVRFQNLTSLKDSVTTKTILVDGLTFYVPESTLEKKQWQKEKICIYIDSGSSMYRLNLSLPSTFDRNYILNNMLIEGKQYTFNFEGRNIVSIIKNL